MISLSVRRPSLLDIVDLMLLRMAKHGRARFSEPEPFYDDFFTEHDITKYQVDARDFWRFQRLTRICEELLDPGALVVDVGCGLGVGARFVPPGQRYVGLDLSPMSVERARHLVPDAEFRLGSMPSLPVADREADLAVCLEVFEHLPDDAAAVAELARIVRPGGYALVSVPQTYYWPSYLALIGHYRHYNSELLASLLSRHGFDVVRRYPMQYTLWRLHHYAYVLLRVANSIVRGLGSERPTMYDGWVYPKVSWLTIAHARAREGDDDPDSTFVLARRRQGGG
jgi:SAM-dependent methyltransferase